MILSICISKFYSDIILKVDQNIFCMHLNPYKMFYVLLVFFMLKYYCKSVFIYKLFFFTSNVLSECNLQQYYSVVDAIL